MRKPIDSPFSLIVSGQSGSGKTTFVKHLLRNLDNVCTGKIEKIVYSYAILQDLINEIGEIPKVVLYQGFPSPLIDENNVIPTLIVIDDMLTDMDEDITVKLFTRLRHANYSVIFLTQNLYHKSKHWRTININTNYMSLFRNPRDILTIEYLGRQMFGRRSDFLISAFTQATETPYNYLFIDLRPYTLDKFRVRQGILPHERNFRYCQNKMKHK